MSDIFKLLQPLKFLDSILQKNRRYDGRKLSKFRKAEIYKVHIDTADCSTVVSYGPTSVICGLKTSLVTPPMDCPDKGILNAFFRFSETCCANLNNYDRTVIVEFVQATLDKILFHSNIIDLHELCLIEGKYVWEIQLEVICMNLNSGIMEAVLMGVLSTLLQCKIPTCDVDLDLKTVEKTDKSEPLKVKSFPVLVSFGIFKNHFFVDPSMEEEEMSHTVLRIAVNPDAKEDEDSIYLFEVSGQTEIEPILIEKCHKIAMTRSQLIKQLMLDT